VIADLKIALTCVYVGATVAVLFAILLPKLQPAWYRRLMTARAFGALTLGVVVCATTSIAHFVQGRPYVGGVCASFATLGLLVVSVSALRLLMGPREPAART